MSRETGHNLRSRPKGHAFEKTDTEPVANPQVRLLTAYRPAWKATTSTQPAARLQNPPPLHESYQSLLDQLTQIGAPQQYRDNLRKVLGNFPQDEVQPPQRPSSDEVEILFTKVLHPEQTRSRGKGSKGGVKHYECQWHECDYKGPLQKCIDHLFSHHVPLKFFPCDWDGCGLRFTRKYDLDKHRKKQHGISRPREQIISNEEATVEPPRQTRATASLRHRPYSTGGRPPRTVP